MPPETPKEAERRALEEARQTNPPPEEVRHREVLAVLYEVRDELRRLPGNRRGDT